MSSEDHEREDRARRRVFTDLRDVKGQNPQFFHIQRHPPSKRSTNGGGYIISVCLGAEKSAEKGGAHQGSDPGDLGDGV